MGFLFSGDNSTETAVFYNKELMTLGDALLTVYQERCEEGNTDTSNLLFGHAVQIDTETGSVSITADEDFLSRIFIPDVKEEDAFSATSLGIYANDLAYDPDSDELQYFENSERNNILQLAWRLAKDEKNGMVVPTWPVVMTRQDVRLLNTVPMEVGLQYGFNYWNAVMNEGVSKYIK